MLIGQTILVLGGGVFTTYYGPWMPRGGNALTAVLEIMKTSATGWVFNVDIETKNAEDSDASPTVLSTFQASTTGTFRGATTGTGVATGCRELVRYKFYIRGTTSEQWIHFRMNPPIWQPN
jgi:hypothetical protein